MLILTQGSHIGHTLNDFNAGDFIVSETLLSPERFNDELHYHNNAHFSFVLKGGCGEKKRTNYERLPGSITWYRAGELHQITNVNQSSHHLNVELLNVFFHKFDIKEDIFDSAARRHAGTPAMMLKVYRELRQPHDNCESMMRMLLLTLLTGEAKVLRAGKPAWVQVADELLHDRWNEKVTLEELSDACEIHPVTLSRYFPAHFSCTLNEYCRTLKINKAIPLIKSSRLSLTEIAYACGFADQSHFTRTFKERTGFLPSAYQKL
jgi:AraC family transcriptional regulator